MTAPVLDADGVQLVVRRMALEIVERTRNPRPVSERLALIGVRRGGIGLSRRLAAELGRAEGQVVPVGSVDISLYRDDASTALPDPKIGPSHVPFDPQGRDVVLVDDVLQTGRTIRAAIDCVLDYGRPRRIWLAVLCDRGGRELPIHADFVGRTVDVPAGQRIDVLVEDAPSSNDRVQLEARP